MVVAPPLRRIVWPNATRIIASKYPPIDLYERVSRNPAIWEALIVAEAMTNPRLRDAAGAIHLVPPEERVSGPGASYVMAPFTHLNPKGARFSDGRQGAYYAAEDLRTAVAETAHHFGRFAADSADGPRYEDMRVLVGRIDAALHDLRAWDSPEHAQVMARDDYTFSQSFARNLRDADSTGVHYPSVRHDGGCCVAIFRPRAVGIPAQTKHLRYHWDGAAVRRYFDYGADVWVDVETIGRNAKA